MLSFSNYKKFIIRALPLLLLLAAGIVIGYALNNVQSAGLLSQKLTYIQPLRSNDQHYKFINPLLLYILPSGEQQWGLADMKNQVQNIIDDSKKHKNLVNASVFFQDLNMGRWMGVNQNDTYQPASMLKVVVMLSYFKLAQSNPTLLYKQLKYTKDIQDFVGNDAYNSSSSLQMEKSYTVEDLINKMIIDSDNGAAYLLINNIDQSSLNSIYGALNISSPDDSPKDFTISPRYYSFFFRVLYSSTYLDRQFSEKALDILSKATFKEGLVAGLPSSIIVAHKFGEYVAHDKDRVSQIELHDCGIVYYPKNPYLLCIMTRGSDLESLKTTISRISSSIYQSYSRLK